MTASKRGGCSVCGRPVEAEFRPFCSKRCADVDLGRWLGERYVVSEPIGPQDKPETLPDEGDGDE
jgi:endogenous inhibitor of DNA gyrase (YacG/DUF329 family)